MYRTPVVVTPPASPLVTVAAMKTYARIDGTAEDDLLADFIKAATEQLELHTNRSFINRTLRLTLDSLVTHRCDDWWDGVRQGPIAALTGIPAPIALPRPPLSSITSIATYSAAGVATPLAPSAYVVDGSTFRLTDAAALPADIRSTAGIEVTYVAGYGPAPTDVPAMIRMACMAQVQAMYDARTCVELCSSALKMVELLRIYPGTPGGL